jgi:hypothetical protein
MRGVAPLDRLPLVNQAQRCDPTCIIGISRFVQSLPSDEHGAEQRQAGGSLAANPG